MVKLCLGSANFGSRYGLDNKKITNLKSLGIKNCSNINEVIIRNFLNIFHS